MAPEDVNLLVSGFHSEDVAAHFHVAAHGFVVDVVSQAVWDFRRVLGQFLRVVGQ